MKTDNENELYKDSIALMETKLARKLFLANKKLACKNAEIEKRAAELILANKELAFQYKALVNQFAHTMLKLAHYRFLQRCLQQNPLLLRL